MSKTVLKSHQSQKTSGKQAPKLPPNQTEQTPEALATLLWVRWSAVPCHRGEEGGLEVDPHTQGASAVQKRTPWFGHGVLQSTTLSTWDIGYCGSSSHGFDVLRLPLCPLTVVTKLRAGKNLSLPPGFCC